MGPKVAVLTLKTIILAGYVTANVLPVTLPKVARLDDYDRTRQVSGVIPNRLELMKRPRVIFGYLSEKDWAFVELVCFMHASWRYVVSLAEVRPDASLPPAVSLVQQNNGALARPARI